MKTNIHPSIIHLRGLSAFAAILSLGTMTSSASADVVVAEYNFDSGSAVSVDADTFTSAGSYVATVPATGSGISSSSSNAYFFPNATGANLTEAISGDDYHAFALDLETSGAVVSLQSLDFKQEFWNTNTTLSFSVSVFIGTSADDFDEASDSLVDFTILGSDYTNGQNAVVARTVALSGIPELQGLSSDLEVRFYFYDDSGASDRTHRLDDITLNASSVIPEASSFALALALASVGSTVILRRGRRNG